MNTSNTKGMWNVLKHILPSRNDNSNIDEAIDSNNFNEFFSEIGIKPTNVFGKLKLPASDINTSNNKLDFHEINVNYILKELLKLPLKSTLDIINIDNKLLRLAAPAISPSLTHIFNLSLYHGFVPDDWKTARITPIFKKKGSKEDPNNYRPISVVSTIAKILEKHIKLELMNYMTNNNLLASSLSAYIRHHSTETALLYLVDKCMSNINNSEINILCSLDLSKGFDVLSHEILLHKLSLYNILNVELKWFKSYLTNRKQYVCINNKLSDPTVVKIGVPQGTVLGPILFLIYINDLEKNIIHGESTNYADDTGLISSGKTVEEAQTNMTLCLQAALSWFKQNRLVVNTSKSTLMPISTSHNTTTVCKDISLIINKDTLVSCTSTKLLGIFIDQNLNFNCHIKYLVKKISPKIGILHRLRQFLPPDVLNIVYKTTIQPIFDYCITVWGNSTKQNIKTLQILQNPAARAVLGNFDFNSSVSLMIKQLKWTTVQNRYTYFTCIMVYKCLNGLAPDYLINLFKYVSETHSYITRNVSNNNLALPSLSTSLYKHSFSYNGALLWNSLPLYIRNSSSLNTFKSMLSHYLNNDIN